MITMDHVPVLLAAGFCLTAAGSYLLGRCNLALSRDTLADQFGPPALPAPDATRRYREAAGREGESRVRAVIERTYTTGDLYNDVFVEQDAIVRQIDHVLVCGRTIVVIETKNWSGNITVDCNGHVEGDAIDKSAANPVNQVFSARALLSQKVREAGFRNVNVIPMLVFAGSGQLKWEKVSGIWITDTKGLPNCINRITGGTDISSAGREALEAVLSHQPSQDSLAARHASWVDEKERGHNAASADVRHVQAGRSGSRISSKGKSRILRGLARIFAVLALLIGAYSLAEVYAGTQNYYELGLEPLDSSTAMRTYNG
ncbi:nuclease-related domain-containing protein [Gluconobacter cerinus]